MKKSYLDKQKKPTKQSSGLSFIKHEPSLDSYPLLVSLTTQYPSTTDSILGFLKQYNDDTENKKSFAGHG
jgi:hypothetical protein